jgi:serine/threonine protein kinase
MSRLGIVHRDLKPDNILLNSKDDKTFDIRLADFGFAAKIKSSQKKTNTTDDKILCGTPGYICPEAINGDGFTLKSDIFCAGAIMFAILTLKHYFNGNSYKEIMRANGQCNLDSLDERMAGFSSEAKDLVRQLMNKDPAKRSSAANALSHGWFANEQTPIKNSLALNKLLARNKFQMCGTEFQSRFQKLISQVSQDISMRQARCAPMGAALSGYYGN